MKIKIPSQTVEVDAEAWANEYGIDVSEVRQNVLDYFAYSAQTKIDLLGLQLNTLGDLQAYYEKHGNGNGDHSR